MRFSGELTPELEREFRDLYYKRKPIFVIAYAVTGILLIPVGGLMWAKISLLYGIVALLIGVLAFLNAFALPQIYWRWWRNQFLSIFGRHLLCEVQSTGLRLKSDIPILEWKNLIGTKETDSLILVYWDKAAAYPIHRRMASNEADWAELMNLIEKNIHRRAW